MFITHASESGRSECHSSKCQGWLVQAYGAYLRNEKLGYYRTTQEEVQDRDK